ncbi:ATP12 family chaperone protein [Phaeovulum sp. W22_SRMD_FR3]|uniref:ATP12 family chaperone protein n=1 Tax=Phaeovulum sp. W22_SRMD_FR3 TaxID=3240274 RepID=UPI003F99A599
MSNAWAVKRFWTSADVSEVEGGFTVTLDGRPVKTPAKAPLVVPTRQMAEAIAAEWDAQTGKVNPATMPVTRGANAAIDKVAIQQAEVASMVVEYGGTDLLCYRAPQPAELIARQAAAWDPLLGWAAEALAAELVVTQGVLPVQQPDSAAAAFAAALSDLSPFEMAALYDLVGITGSLVIGLAVARGRLSAEEAWELSRIDEHWQIEQWGQDDEANELAALKRAELLLAARFWQLAQPQN